MKKYAVAKCPCSSSLTFDLSEYAHAVGPTFLRQRGSVSELCICHRLHRYLLAIFDHQVGHVKHINQLLRMGAAVDLKVKVRRGETASSLVARLQNFAGATS